MLLADRPEQQGEVVLVVRGGTYAPTRSLRMALGADVYALEPAELIEAGEDFEWVRYRVTERKPGSQDSRPVSAHA